MPSNQDLAVANDCVELEAILRPCRQGNRKVALVPTMGALHEGHLSLVRLAKEHADTVVVSIFVNPKQFGPNEDLGRYPRSLESDLEALRSVDADIAYVPAAEEIYPPGFATAVTVDHLTDCLDGASRGPGYFTGIATVVLKLLNRVRPTIAIFGEKDYQQLLVISRMVEDLDLGIDILGAPIARASDGLALSSRNRYLSPQERDLAALLPQVMQETIVALCQGADAETALSAAIERLTAAGLAPVDYLECRHVPDLAPLTGPIEQFPPGKVRLFAAVMLSGTRLIDNMPVILR
ncbi:pantoate--beta-alanine ligase [Parvularcula bermudensis HTCC2503]|uniref:Pantothenate synthetase n=1 Tax=Parvularcula bermudensis (strain ATCC BAA-594 / HTCC2503 / KCTC 12087) TaxID=314260 RepID=E0TFM5_PARBH|nr:pantoate--beta-alanine ligase [Parvularcula bermudensis]ADM10585.1 pantoate--beta-alanine ligase [Parvularcula bermudensis HTCC2503]